MRLVHVSRRLNKPPLLYPVPIHVLSLTILDGHHDLNVMPVFDWTKHYYL